ncbi:hypothetical protein EG68_01985 [Paragonimus skrjabini miyazakii]|uniref:SH3 domain-containing protein n=1 Tax=Paragonimus skrjabini miyazakii TaxID=59628 RepID=A0A8S9ZAE8_9TREM|nr:hypothetical protein EG68_01985 [Paragonimus skrjabini miyazakii]
MDVPGTEHPDFSIPALSGGSSPGRGFAVPVDSSVSQPFRDETSKGLFEPASIRYCGTRTGSAYEHNQPQTPHFPGELHRPIPLDPRKNVGFGSPLKDIRGRVPYVTVPGPDCVPSAYRVPRNVSHVRSQANGSHGMLFREVDETKSFYFVIKDYIARRPDELTLRVGQIIGTIWYRSNLSMGNLENDHRINRSMPGTITGYLNSFKLSIIMITNRQQTCCAFSMNIFLL